ncbi:uncharacterized protein [Asterias amurensis]|uniref:uncharacterized protein n=1 Tax=Asterias amurensis TaxID=7602 RepID=UPI003AB3B072
MELRSCVSDSGYIHVNESTEFSCNSSFDSMNVHGLSTGSCINHGRCTSGWDGSTLLLPATNPSDQWCPGQTSEVQGAQLRHPYAQPIPLYINPSQEVTVPVQRQEHAKSQKVTKASQQCLSTPSNYSPITWVPPPSTPTPPSANIVASSLELFQCILETSTASKLQVSDLVDTRGSRVFTATDSVFNSDAACLHTPTVQLGSSTPGSTRRGTCSVQQKPGKMPCVHEETSIMVDNLADDGREKTLVTDWPRDIPRPYVVFPSKNVYVDGTTIASSVDNNIFKETKTSEAISKKNYILRRNDKGAVIVTSGTMETLHKTTKSNGDNIRLNDSQRDIVRRGPSEKKGFKKKSDICRDKTGSKNRKDSSERSKSDRNQTPPPITRTTHPKAPMIPGTPLIAPRPLLPSTIKAIPLQTKPLDSRPLSPITHLTNTVFSSDSRHVAIRPRTVQSLNSSSTSFVISGSSTGNSVTDVPVRPVPITGSLRPCLSSNQPRYLPVHFPSRHMLPIPIPQLAAYTGSPLTFIHPGIHIFPGSRNQPYPTLTNLPTVGLPTVPVPFFKRTHPFPSLNNGVPPDSLALRQRYCEALAQPSRRQSRRRRQSSGDSQPAEEDGPEGQKIRRKQANARERDRVNHLNSGFEHLRTVLPWLHHGRRVSKVDTLRSAIDYINHLQRILWESDATSYITAPRPVGPPMSTTDMCKFVHHHHYPQFGMLPTTITFGESGHRTAVDPVTCRGLELGQPPPAKIPRFSAPHQLYPPRSNYWFNNLTLHGPLPFPNGPNSESTSHAPTNDATKMSDTNNNVTNAVGR